MKILLVINKPNRETPIMEAIKREILIIEPHAFVEIREMCSSGFDKFVFKFRPDVILTFPFTCEGFSHIYYLFKYFLNTKIISFRAEGVIDFRSEYNLEWAVGMDQYGKTLVDYELFWGQKLANAVGNHLLMHGKISSMERIKITGYPRLEHYFDKSLFQDPALPIRIKQKLNEYTKDKIALFITGFQLANYTRQNLIDAKDLVKESDPNFEDKLDKLLASVEIAKRFRNIWIDNVKRAALENPDVLIVSKKHPIEKREDYESLNGIKNIFFIYEDINVHELTPFVSILFHYGSTALVDAYLSGIPSVYVHTKESQLWYPDLEWPSSRKIEVNDISITVKNCLSENLLFQMSPDIKRVLREIFNIEIGKPYRPSSEIAKIILDKTPPQKIKIYDPYLWKVLATVIRVRIGPLSFARIGNFCRKIYVAVKRIGGQKLTLLMKRH